MYAYKNACYTSIVSLFVVVINCCVLCCWNVLHFERAWSARHLDTDRHKTVCLHDLMTQNTSAGIVVKNVYISGWIRTEKKNVLRNISWVRSNNNVQQKRTTYQKKKKSNAWAMTCFSYSHTLRHLRSFPCGRERWRGPKYIYNKKWKYTPAVRSKIWSKLIFASCVWYSDRAHYELCVLIKDIGGVYIPGPEQAASPYTLDAAFYVR